MRKDASCLCLKRENTEKREGAAPCLAGRHGQRKDRSIPHGGVMEGCGRSDGGLAGGGGCVKAAGIRLAFASMHEYSLHPHKYTHTLSTSWSQGFPRTHSLYSTLHFHLSSTLSKSGHV